MAKRVLLGMLTPSSNTILEPVTAAMLADVPGVTAHFARFRVTEISLGDRALGQFDNAPILEAARLLADARVEPALAGANSDATVQFERQGYFVRDRDSKPGSLVFNRTVGLRDSYAKAAAKA